MSTNERIVDPNVLGARVRARRKALGLNQDDLAALAGVSRRFLTALEGGKAAVQLDKVLLVLQALGLEMQVALRGSGS